MQRNMGLVDRIIRVLIAGEIAILYSIDLLAGATAITLGIVAIVFIATSLFGFCPLYFLLGISTNKRT